MKKQGLQFNFSHLFSLLASYIIILAWHGFFFASNDVVDVMTYAKYLQNNSLFPHDFYIQNIASTLPNERIVFAGFLSVFGQQLSWLTLVFHAFASMLLLEGIYRVSKLFIKNEFLIWLVPLILFIPLYGIGIGDCELYYNMFIASLAAKAIAIWAVYYFIKDKKLFAYFLLIPVSFIHPTVGAQLFLVFSLSSMILFLINRDPKKLWGLLLYICFGGVWIFLLQQNVYEGEIITKGQLFDIFEFRLAHHFFPEYFGLKNWGISILLIALALYFYNHSNKRVPLILILSILLGMLLYTLSHFFYQMEIVLSSQWFKSYIWLELFAVIALIGLFEKLIKNNWILNLAKKMIQPSLWIVAFILFVLVHIEGNYISNKKHEFFTQDYFSDEAKIALDAKSKTGHDAIFVAPIEFTEFKYFSERSLYIDYKTVVHRKNALGQWYERIGQVYGIELMDRLKGDDLYYKAAENWKKLSLEQLAFLKKKGVTHLVIDRDTHFPLEIIAENESYRIYAL